jgi:hypothetical protein
LHAYQQSADIDQYRLRNLHTARDLAAARLEMVLADDAKDAAARAADRQQRNPKPPASDR